MWIFENWKICHESPTEVKRKFRLDFDLRYDQVPDRGTFRKEYMKIKKNKGALQLVPGKKVSPKRINITPECQNQEQVEEVSEHFRSNPSGMSIKDRSLDLDIPQSTVRTILRHNLHMKAWKILGTIQL